jgi:glycosyltransferase involved in cell wall biosynthesis
MRRGAVLRRIASRSAQVSLASDSGAPLVSVIIPAYNVSGYIAEALESVFAQEYARYEVIVINDGSPDTATLEAELARFRDRIVYLTQPNGGPSAARNAGILRARGTYVAFLDADDQWLPDCLADQVARATADPGLSVVYGDARIIGNPAYAGKTLMELARSTDEVTFLSLLSLQCPITTSCAMVRRDACVAAGMFDPALRRSEDFDLWLRIAHQGGRFAFTKKILGLYRRHDTGASADLLAMADAVLAVLDKCERELPLSVDERAEIVAARNKQRALRSFLEGKLAFAGGDFSTARRALADANRVMRSTKLSLVVLLLSVSPTSLSWLHSMTTGRR